LEWLQTHGLESELESSWQVPAATVDPAAGHPLDLLTDPGIRQRYLSRANAPDQAWTLDDALAWYGLPLSPPQELGGFITQRFQRAILRRPTTPQPGQTSSEATIQPLGPAVRDLVFEGQYSGADSP